MKKINDDIDFIKKLDNFANKKIIDVGCGAGDLVRWFASQKADVTGLEVEPVLSKAVAQVAESKQKYINAVGEDLPFEDMFADYIFYMASFHHIPVEKMEQGIFECKRVLKRGGKAVIVEPVPEEESYYELVKLARDEKFIQERAQLVLKNCADKNFSLLKEDVYYFERSLEDYKLLIDNFLKKEQQKKRCYEKAEVIAEVYARSQNIPPEKFRFRSIIKVYIYQKN